MQLSIIIVNYNVKHFLEQCLCSVEKAAQHITCEVLVVDNNSTDGSMAYLKPKFPWVRFIENKDNPGFGRANNQALQLATGNYILFLNPDTLLPENCLETSLAFMDANPRAGAAGIRMVDGSGSFLPESKRAFPSPLTSLFKLSGLSAVFPRSKIFGRYHLGHLPEHQNHEVDVLAGAFMLLRKEVADTTGGFDEQFFMYGEDVDLSYRIQQAGWKNYYFADSSIIHFKGESTKKGSLNYVLMFYQAMSLFVKKHYGGGSARLFNILIQAAIWARAGVSAVSRFIRRIGLPVIDAAIVVLCVLAAMFFWADVVKPGLEYPDFIIRLAMPAYAVLFIISGALAGLYDKWYRPWQAWQAMMLAVLVNLAVYSMLPEGYRFSRGVILISGLMAAIAIVLLRWLLQKAGVIEVLDESREYRQTLIAGNEEDFKEVNLLLQQAGRKDRVLGRVATLPADKKALGTADQLNQLLANMPAREIIFCISTGFSLQQVLQLLEKARPAIRYKFHYRHSHSVVGSDSRQTSGEALDMHQQFALGNPYALRKKRLFDIASAVLLLLTLPLQLLLVRKLNPFLNGLLPVLTGKKTWIGYFSSGPQLPVIKSGILTSTGHLPGYPPDISAETRLAIDHRYAKDYNWRIDLQALAGFYKR